MDMCIHLQLCIISRNKNIFIQNNFMSSLKHKDKQPQNFNHYILLKIILSFYQVNFPTST